LPAEVEVERHRLEQLYVDTLRRLATLVKGQEVEFYLEKLLAVEPADESAQQALVLSFLAHGRRDLARRQVKRWQQALAELEVEPSPEARVLWAEVTNKKRS
jgi:DNA-binding SARP family transcriptional activator